MHPTNEWDEHKKFEMALAEVVGINSPNTVQMIAQSMQKPKQEVEKYYNDLVDDLNLIESGLITVDYPDYSSPSSPVETSEIISENTKKRGRPWTQHEHGAFLEGILNLGKGDWKTIARDFVKTRTSSQVASHAQKFCNRHTDPKAKKRASIHDITSVGNRCVLPILQSGWDSVSQPQNQQMPPDPPDPPQYSNFQH